MKTITKKMLLPALLFPALMSAQVDLTIGLNYSYDPPTNCNNQINNITVDICNNGGSSAGSFLVGIYLYEPTSQKHWVLDQTTINSLSGNACITINNWNINMNNYPSLPPAGNNYRIGVWADTADAVSESDENNNTSLLSGNIQVCTATGLKELSGSLRRASLFPNPATSASTVRFSLQKDEKAVVSVEDISGKMVMKAFEGGLSSGEQNIDLDLSSLERGLYFVKIKTESFTETRKLEIEK
jgi:hypothetical protein